MSLAPGKARLIPHSALAPTERVLYETHPSRWFYYPSVVFPTVLALAIEYLILTGLTNRVPSIPRVTAGLTWLTSHTSPYGYPALLLVFLGVAIATWWAWHWRGREWREFSYAVTDTRVIQSRAARWGGSDLQEIPLRQIRDVEVIRSPRAPAGRIGTLRVRSLSSAVLQPEQVENGYLLADRRNGSRLPPPQPGDGDVVSPLSDFALSHAGSGVEWWIGIPKAMYVERLIASQTRSVFHDDTPMPVMPTPPPGP